MEGDHKTGREFTNTDDKAWVTITAIVNLGNYENYKLEAGYSRTIESGENPMEVLKDMEENIGTFVSQGVHEIKTAGVVRRKLKGEPTIPDGNGDVPKRRARKS